MSSASGIYSYSVFGLNVASEIHLPELVACLLTGEPSDRADVTITRGEVPARLDQPNLELPWLSIGKDAFLMSLPNNVRFLVENGSRITVEVPLGIPTSSFSVYILCSAFGAVFHQRGILALHAGVVKVGDRCALFCGESKAGKSTLTRGLVDRGYAMQGDDLGVIRFAKDGSPLVYPAYPQMKLWADALEHFGEATDTRERILPELDKYAIPMVQSFNDTPLPIGKIYIISAGSDAEVELKPIRGIEKLGNLIDHTYRIEFLRAMEQEKTFFPVVKELVPHIRMDRLLRPRGMEHMNAVLDMLEQDFSQW